MQRLYSARGIVVLTDMVVHMSNINMQLAIAPRWLACTIFESSTTFALQEFLRIDPAREGGYRKAFKFVQVRCLSQLIDTVMPA